jgi:hypothetical protein
MDTTPTMVVDVAAVLSRWYTKVHAAQANLGGSYIRAARERLWGQLGVGATLTITASQTDVLVVNERPS